MKEYYIFKFYADIIGSIAGTIAMIIALIIIHRKEKK